MFTLDNTYGFSQLQLDEMNEEVKCLMDNEFLEGYDLNDEYHCNIYKGFEMHVLKKFNFINFPLLDLSLPG